MDEDEILYDVPSSDGKLIFQIKAKYLNADKLNTLQKSSQEDIDWHNLWAKNPAPSEKKY
jgi:hypothetical protein